MELDPVEALSHVVHDAEPDPGAVEWAAAELLGGRELPDVATQLVDQGWPPADVDRVVEAARVRTRLERGVITRDHVVGALNGRYRRTRWGSVNPIGFLLGLRAALGALRHLKRSARRGDADGTG